MSTDVEMKTDLEVHDQYAVAVNKEHIKINCLVVEFACAKHAMNKKR